jgi:DnaK suppressor protein
MAALTRAQIAEMEAKLFALRDSLTADLERCDEPAQRERISPRLQAVQEALARIAAGSYGECLRCGEKIKFRRLQIHPATRLCLDCQSGSSP